jgi:hypothetical protein
MTPRLRLACLSAAIAVTITTASAVAASVGPLQVRLDPQAITWRDPVRVTVSDTRWTSCGSSAFHLSVPDFGVLPGGGYRLTLRLEESCTILAPPTLQPIEVSADLGRLVAGSYELRVEDLPSGRRGDLPFRVHRPGSERLDLPAVATDANPGKLRVHAIGWGPPALQLEGNVVHVFVQTCVIPLPILSPPVPAPSVLDAEVPLPALSAGDYEVRLESGCGWPAAGQIPPSVLPALVRANLHVWRADGCVPGDETLCLQGGRFRVTGTWRAFDGSTGVAHALPLPGNQSSGLLWFFDRDNAELTVKTIDGCGLNQRWWVFAASGSNVRYTVIVEDTRTGDSRSYGNTLGTLPPLVADTDAFLCP